MYVEAYELLREILTDEALDNYLFNETGKHLAIIDAGAQISSPSVKITFTDSSITCADNTKQEVNYNILFTLPMWGADALKKSHEFLDVVIKAFFEHEQGKIHVMANRVIRISPSISEYDEESELWAVSFNVTVLIFMN